MSYHRSFFAPMGAAPGMTMTNVEKAAVKAFQASMGLPADGIVGPTTLAAMAKAGMTIADIYAGKQAPPPTAPGGSSSKRTLLIAGGVVAGIALLGYAASRSR